MKRRDITKDQYREKMENHGFQRRPFLGYWQLPIEGRTVCVSDLNAGDNYRAKLAYMLSQLEQEKRKAASL